MRKCWSKKWLVVFGLLLLLIASFALCGCGETGEDATPPAEGQDEAQTQTDAPTDVKVACIFNVPDPANGGGFERMMLEGCAAIEEKYGWQVDIAENVAYSKISEVSSAYADKGYDLIFYPDAGMVESWNELADQYPDTWFCMMSLVDEMAQGNACAIRPNKFGYGVITGIVMANLSETNKIGIIGGLPVGSVMMEFSGIIEGCKALYPDTEVLIGWSGDYVDVTKHSEATRLLIEQGVDVLFTVTGPGYKGVWEAAEAGGAKIVGYAYDSYDIAPNVVAASVAYDGPKQFLTIADAYANGTLENRFYDAGYDYITVCDFRGSIDEETEAHIRQQVEQVISGEINIPEVLHEDL